MWSCNSLKVYVPGKKRTMSGVLLRAERLDHYRNQQLRRIGFDKAGSRDRRYVKASKIADVTAGCKYITAGKKKLVCRLSRDTFQEGMFGDRKRPHPRD
jgi:hypothetical protein